MTKSNYNIFQIIRMVRNAKNSEETNKLRNIISDDYINEKDVCDMAVLHYASILNAVDLVTYLLSRGADPNVLSKTGTLPIHLTSNYEITKLLVEASNKRFEEDPASQTLAYSNVLEDPSTISLSTLSAEAELRKKSNIVNIQYGPGYTALHNAIYNKEYETVKYLLQQGANPNIQSKSQHTAWTIFPDSSSIQRILHEHTCKEYLNNSNFKVLDQQASYDTIDTDTQNNTSGNSVSISGSCVYTDEHDVW